MTAQHKIRLLVAEDHAIVRQGLVSLLTGQDEFVVVGEVGDGRAAVEETLAKNPDLVLMDIGMPDLNGFEATRRIKRYAPLIKVLVLSGYDNEDYILEIVSCGADGYVLKSSKPEELFSAIRTVVGGDSYFSSSIAKILADYQSQELTRRKQGEVSPPSAKDRLTPREREILQLIAEGNSHQQISDRLNISVRTVDTHRTNIMRKLDRHDTASLVTFAIKNRIVILPKY